MLQKLNNGAYKALELSILRSVESGHRVQVLVQPVYQGTSHIPAVIYYSYRVGTLTRFGWYYGNWTTKTFSN